MCSVAGKFQKRVVEKSLPCLALQPRGSCSQDDSRFPRLSQSQQAVLVAGPGGSMGEHIGIDSQVIPLACNTCCLQPRQVDGQALQRSKHTG